jgi:hypothetical protein
VKYIVSRTQVSFLDRSLGALGRFRHNPRRLCISCMAQALGLGSFALVPLSSLLFTSIKKMHRRSVSLGPQVILLDLCAGFRVRQTRVRLPFDYMLRTDSSPFFDPRDLKFPRHLTAVGSGHSLSLDPSEVSSLSVLLFYIRDTSSRPPSIFAIFAPPPGPKCP